MGLIVLSDKAKKFEKEVNDLAKLHVLLIRHVERNTTLRIMTMRDFDNVLQNGQLTCTYGRAMKNLKHNINKLCKDERLINMANDLENRINNSELFDMRFGIQGQRPFSDVEHELTSWLMRRQMYMDIELKSLSFISENIGVPVSTIKQACQSERLLNTRKIGKMWIAHIDECREYWGIEKPVEKNLLFGTFEY